MKNLIMHKKGEDPYILWIKKRIRLNLNFLSITTGTGGNGKSWFDLAIAEKIDPAFNPEKQIAFTFTEFMNSLNGCNGDDEELKKKKYKVIMFDEIQISISKREWQSRINKLFNYITSTFRHQNIIVLINSPFADFIDSNTMKLLHAKIETRGWRKSDNKSAARFKILQYNDKLSKMYEHSLYLIKGKGVLKLDGSWILDRPSKRTIDVYERRKTEFTQRLNKNITKEIAEIEGGINEEEKEIEMLPGHKDIYTIYHTKSHIQKEIGEFLGISAQDVSKVMKTMDKYYFGWRENENLLKKVQNSTSQPAMTNLST
jgi:hypothetical protein